MQPNKCRTCDNAVFNGSYCRTCEKAIRNSKCPICGGNLQVIYFDFMSNGRKVASPKKVCRAPCNEMYPYIDNQND
jgi:hypothetical protein